MGVDGYTEDGYGWLDGFEDVSYLIPISLFLHASMYRVEDLKKNVSKRFWRLLN
jgi:hypothetical protein